jgi:hypothetical protein
MYEVIISWYHHNDPYPCKNELDGTYSIPTIEELLTDLNITKVYVANRILD